MVFSSLIFLWVFLPLLLVLYYLIPNKQSCVVFKNAVLLIFSLIFYTWGEPKYILLLLFSSVVNYISGLLMYRKHAKLYLFCCIGINLGLLGYFKYYNFFMTGVNHLLRHETFALREIALPLGISFYTFQALSYVIDVYRKEVSIQKNYLKLLLYIVLFPQLVAGPIVKYKDVQEQLYKRTTTASKTAYGVKRFIYGLAKKVLISNQLAVYADLVLDSADTGFSSGVYWMAALFYGLQIYYDFSGYSDMAIGLGKMFGFDFIENFNYPYISGSIQEFWRRWHISLSTWFKEYVYIPLGGNRRGNTRTYLNLLIVFTLTGLWHGASLNFIFWGLYYGFFLILERLFLGRILQKNRFKVFNHLYVTAVMIIGWVPFRMEGLNSALGVLKNMFTNIGAGYGITYVYGSAAIMMLLISCLLSGPIQYAFPKLRMRLYDENRIIIPEYILLFVLLFFCLMKLASSAYNPFIYFRF